VKRGGKGSVFISVNRQRGELLGIERERGVCSTYRLRNVKGSTYNREGREGDSRMKTVEKPQREKMGTENTVKNK
jgi:hypothetical protein